MPLTQKPRGKNSCPEPWEGVWPSDFLNCAGIHFCVLSHQVRVRHLVRAALRSKTAMMIPVSWDSHPMWVPSHTAPELSLQPTKHGRNGILPLLRLVHKRHCGSCLGFSMPLFTLGGKPAALCQQPSKEAHWWKKWSLLPLKWAWWQLLQPRQAFRQCIPEQLQPMRNPKAESPSYAALESKPSETQRK